MEKNIAYIDWQNLHLGTKNDWWICDFRKLRVFLEDKFKVKEAYYFLWFISEEEQELYNNLQRAWFIVVFREHSSALKWNKKWNVDVDIVFEIMKKVHNDNDFNKIVLVTGDGDYIKLVRYLLRKDLLERIIFPNENHSSLYQKLGNKVFYYLKDAKNKIQYKRKRVS